MAVIVRTDGYHVAEWSDRRGPVYQAVEVWRGLDPFGILLSEGRNGNPSRWRGPERRSRAEATTDGDGWLRETALLPISGGPQNPDYWADRLSMP